MALDPDFLETVALAATRHPGTRHFPWPRRGDVAGLVPFATYADWQRFVLQFTLPAGIPQIVTLKFERAQKLHILAWIDLDLIKAGELVALTTLELALKDRYGDKVKDRQSNISFARLLQYVVERDGLTDDLVPMCVKHGGAVVQNLYETDEARKKKKGTMVVPPMTLAEIRNSLAHGYPFDGLPWSGLLELVRDLIEYAYRGMIAEARGVSDHDAG